MKKKKEKLQIVREGLNSQVVKGESEMAKFHIQLEGSTGDLCGNQALQRWSFRKKVSVKACEDKVT